MRACCFRLRAKCLSALAVRYGTPSPKNVSNVEAGVHTRYEDCRGPRGRKVSLAQGNGMGGAGAVLCDDNYYVRSLACRLRSTCA